MILGAETVRVVLWAAQEIEQGGAGLAGMEDRLVDQRSAQRQLPPAWIPPGLEVAERAPPPEPVQDPDDLAGTLRHHHARAAALPGGGDELTVKPDTFGSEGRRPALGVTPRLVQLHEALKQSVGDFRAGNAPELDTLLAQ